MSINNPPMGYTHMPSSAYDSTLYPAKFPMTYHPASYLFSHCVFRTGSELVPDFPDWRSDLHQEKTGQQKWRTSPDWFRTFRTGSRLLRTARDQKKRSKLSRCVFGFRTGLPDWFWTFVLFSGPLGLFPDCPHWLPGGYDKSQPLALNY